MRSIRVISSPGLCQCSECKREAAQDTETASRESLATRLIRHRFTQQKFYPKTLEMLLLGIFLRR